MVKFRIELDEQERFTKNYVNKLSLVIEKQFKLYINGDLVYQSSASLETEK